VKTIRIDYTRALSDAVGEHGVSQAELEAFAGPSREALAAVQARRGADLRWLDLPYASDVHASVRDFAQSVQGRFENVCVLGIGGSALGMTALHSALNGPFHNLAEGGRPRLFVLDNVDPELVGEFLERVDPAKTLFNVISKSGGTAETMAQFLIVRAKLTEALGERAHRDHIVLTTDAEKGPLREIAGREGYAAFTVPDGVGGRFSVLCPVGLLPAALVGIQIDELLAGAAAMDSACKNPELFENPALIYAALQHLLHGKGMPMSVAFVYSDRLKFLADWYAQLLAESLGKRRGRKGADVFRGPTPIRAVGVTDQHSQVQLYCEGPFDKWFTLHAVEQYAREVEIPLAFKDLESVAYLGRRKLGELFDAEREGTSIALTDAGRPNATVWFPSISAHSVGQYLFLMEVAVAVMGEHYDVDAFDQPGVEAGKLAAYALMGRPGYEERRSQIEAARALQARVV
jgi:glucose-6-phosphate isomerase